MIPLRVYLQNFLCHREQEFLFDGHPVWLLHGPNGVGKSAVFDAMVYSLFGEHRRREGAPNAVGDLVRYGESSMRVEFDFEYRDRRYRVWRIRNRTGQPRQGVFELDDNAKPRPLRDVNSVRDLDDWVARTLGLNYEQFVSAVLLRQGAAERLIDAKRDARRDLFRGIIDLEPYIKFHNVITTERTEVNGVVRSLRSRIETMPGVTEEQVIAATLVRDDATATSDLSREVENLARLRLEQSRNWERLSSTRQTLQGQLDAARDRADRAEELERSVNRLRVLRMVVPAISRITRLSIEASAAQTKFDEFNLLHQGAVSQQEAILAAAEQERQKAVVHRERVTELDQQIFITNADCLRLRAELAQAEQAVDLHRQLQEARNRQYDPNLDAQLARAEESVLEAQAARDAYPRLDVILRNRTIYLQASVDASNALASETAIVTNLTRLEIAVNDATRAVELAGERAQAARQENAVGQARLTEVRARLTRFCTVAGEAACSECGQSIDAAHAQREQERLEQALHDAEQRAQRDCDEMGIATQAVAAAQRLAQQSERDHRAAENSRNEAIRNRQDAERRAAAARVAFENVRSELTRDTASRVGDIETCGFPTLEEVNQARGIGRELQGRMLARNDFQTRCQERDNNTAQIQMLTQAVQAFGAPLDVASIQVQQVQCERRLREFNFDRATEEQNRTNAESAEQNFSGQIQQVTDQLNQVTSLLGGAQNQLENARRAHGEAVAALPEEAATWNPDELANELQSLEITQVEREFDALANDRAIRAEWERNLAETERQIEEQVLPNARRPAAEVQPLVEEAEKRVRETDRERQVAQQHLDKLTCQQVERGNALQALIDAERNHELHDRLADLLGPEGIQLNLLRNAEQRIIETANEVLNRVSRGELRFDPPDLSGSQAFDLNVRRLGCPEPIPVSNLSGGQRCRVAISLALAVCRFASREAHPLQSVIIDEAFANLDREGRMAMIEILRDTSNVGEILRRIIVVSHHEDVASAFPVYYRLENSNGTTTVTRCG